MDKDRIESLRSLIDEKIEEVEAKESKEIRESIKEIAESWSPLELFDSLRWHFLSKSERWNQDRIMEKLGFRQIEDLTKVERIFLYNLYMEKYNSLLEKEIFERFFLSGGIFPYWDRVKALFDKKEIQLLTKKEWETCFSIIKELYSNMVKMIFELESNVLWVENFKLAFSLYEITPHSIMNVTGETHDGLINHSSYHYHEKLREVVIDWYQRTNQTYGTKYSHGGLYRYMQDIKGYWYLFDEKNKDIAREKLYSLILEKLDDDEENLYYIRDIFERFF